jgi:hypothetical protein
MPMSIYLEDWFWKFSKCCSMAFRYFLEAAIWDFRAVVCWWRVMVWEDVWAFWRALFYNF